MGQVDAAVRQADVVEDGVQLARRDRPAGWRLSTRSASRAVSSMRVPVLARRCRMNCPLSVFGKKSWPSQGTSAKTRQAADQEDRDEHAAAAHQQIQHAAIGMRAAARSRARSRAGTVPADCASGPCVMRLGPQQIHRHRRHQRARQHVGREHREHHGFGQRHEQIARDAGAARTSARTRCRCRASRPAPAPRSAPRRRRIALAQRLPLLEVALDVLDRHRGVVHQDADRQRQAAQRHDVDRLAERSSAP